MKIALYIITLVAILVVSYLIFSNLSYKRLNKKYKTIFNDVYGKSPFDPSYEFKWSYAYPSFTVTFASNSELNNAKDKGLNNLFSKRILEVCKDMGSKKDPFEVEKAIWFTSEEEIENIRETYGKEV